MPDIPPNWLTLLGSALTGGLAFGGVWLRLHFLEKTAEKRRTGFSERLEEIHESVNGGQEATLAQNRDQADLIRRLEARIAELVKALSATKSLSRRILSVLVVEDNDNDRVLLERALGGHMMVPASNRAELERALTENPFDVVLIDPGIPGMPWPESLEIVRAKWPRLPVVIVSGAMSDTQGYTAVLDGADDFLPKARLDSAVLDHIMQRAVALAAARP